MPNAENQKPVDTMRDKFEQFVAANKGWRETIIEEIYNQNWNEKTFMAHTHLSESVYKSLMRRKGEKKLESLVAICLGLRLSVEKSMYIINDAGYAFKGDSFEHFCYKYFIEEHLDIDEAEDRLCGEAGQTFITVKD